MVTRWTPRQRSALDDERLEERLFGVGQKAPDHG
jgi:hypothetical protein